MIRCMKPVAAILLACLILVGGGNIAAAMPYETYYMDPYSSSRDWWIQPVYMPEGVSRGRDEAGIGFNQPSDLASFASSIYVADKGNSRVVELDEDGEFVRAIGTDEGEGKLKQPEGVYVDESGILYVADTGNSRVVLFDSEGKFLRAYGKPVSPLLPDSFFFVPTKLVVDLRGVLYVVSKGSYQGILRISPDGEFGGFFGANKAQLTYIQRLQRMVLNRDQLKKEAAVRPAEIVDAAISKDGFIITVNSNPFTGQLKKLNAGGINAFANRSFLNAYQLSGVAVDSQGLLFVLDRDSGVITVYDEDGVGVVRFGDKDEKGRQIGVFGYPSALTVDDNNRLWVADENQNIVQILKRTEFGEMFLDAIRLYSDGFYKESRLQWEAVTERNEMVTAAYRGLGMVALGDRKYEEASTLFRKGYDAQGYSKAFWEIRMEAIRTYGVGVLAALAILYALVLLGRRPVARAAASAPIPGWLRTMGTELGEFRSVMFKPYEGFYKLKERRISAPTILFLLVAAAVVNIGQTLFAGFLFDTREMDARNLLIPLAVLFIPWMTWIVANYLISTIKDGEGRFKEVFQASTFALAPYVFLMLPYTIVSNIVVLEEKLIADFISQLSILWVMVLLFIMTQVIHHFDFIEALKNVAITVVTIGVIWIFLVILAALSYNLFNFFYELLKEASLYV